MGVFAAAGVDPSGTVTATVDGAMVDSRSLVNGAATLTVGPFTTVGDHVVTVDYAGDSNTASGSTTTSVTVTKPVPPPLADTTTTATAAAMIYGTPGQVDVKVSSTKATSGSVQVLAGRDVLANGPVAANGSATLPLQGTALPVGSHALTVEYLGDALNKPSQGTVQVEVTKAGSTSAAVVTPAQVVVKQGLVTVRASVTAAGFTPTGDVEVYVDGVRAATKPLSDGAAVLEIGPFATVGTRSVVVRYVGDASTSPSATAATSVSVVKAKPTMTVTTQPDRITPKSDVRMTVSLAAPGQVVTGSVGISWGGKVITGNLSGGAITVGLGQFKSAGSYDVRVVYGGSSLAESVTRTVTVTVLKK